MNNRQAKRRRYAHTYLRAAPIRRRARRQQLSLPFELQAPSTWNETVAAFHQASANVPGALARLYDLLHKIYSDMAKAITAQLRSISHARRS